MEFYRRNRYRPSPSSQIQDQKTVWSKVARRWRRRYIFGSQCPPQQKATLKKVRHSPGPWPDTLSGVGEGVSWGGCCCVAGPLDTTKLIAGERSERSANLVHERGSGRNHKAFDAADDVGTGGGMRYRSTPILMSPRVQTVKKK